MDTNALTVRHEHVFPGNIVSKFTATLGDLWSYPLNKTKAALNGPASDGPQDG
jgi:hypothetical protein